MTGKIFDFKLVFTQIPDLLRFLPITMELAIASTLFGMLLGLLIAIIKIKKVKVLDKVATFYVSLVRGTPVLVQLYIAYFGVPMVLKYINQQTGSDLKVAAIPGFVYAVLALGFNQSAFDAEVFRAALQSVDKGQHEAAAAIGMTGWQSLRRIIIPEALSVALPSLGNSFINAIKGTSLAFTCAVVEMTAEGKILSGRNYRYFEVYVSLAIIYWAITIIFERILKWVEKRISIPDQVEQIAIEELEDHEALGGQLRWQKSRSLS
ncbi:MAG: amino acid ABC transporter permease [Lachnospiraceae bacterium]|nr:amino acid ABC transporter permease [Lachnospiraceae bacterium]